MHVNTKEHIYTLISYGYISIQELNSDERRKLVSLYIEELDYSDSIFEDKDPSRFILARFLDNPLSSVYASHIADEITQCIFAAHDSRLEDLFNEIAAQYDRERGIVNDFDEHRLADNRERYLDLKASGF